MKRRLLSLLLAVCMTLPLGILASCAPGGEAEEGSGQEALTRGEWIALLGEAFGMDNYATEEPYFEDVPEDDPVYPYVQAAADWGVLSAYTGQAELGLDEPVTYEEAGTMAALAAGWTPEEDELLSDGSPDPEAALGYAQEMGILGPDADPEDEVAQWEGEEVTEAAKETYLNAPVEERADVVFAPGLVDLRDLPQGMAAASGSQVSLSGAVLSQDADGAPVVTIGGSEIREGGVIVLPPTQLAPAGIAYKVTGIQEAGGQILFDTTEPTLEELYDELSYSGTVAADPADIIWAEGVTAGTSASSLSAAGEGTTYHIELLSAGAGDLRADPMASHTFGQDFHFELGKGAVKGESTTNLGALGSGAGAQALEESNFVYDKIPSIEDFGGSTEPWTQDLTVTDKYSGGYKITGDINLNAITVTAGVEYKKFWGVPYGIESAKVQVDSDIGATLRLEGNFSEEITIATIPIPLGPTGLSVSIDLSLYVNASGELEVRATLHSQTGFEYNGKGLVKSPSTSSAEAAAEMAVEVDFGARLAASLDALGVVKLADVRADLGGTLTADAYVGGTCDVVEDGGVTTLHYKQSMGLGADLYVPIISISVGGDDSLIGMIGLSKTWDIMTKDNAQHFELMDYEWVFWEATVTVGEDGEILSAEEKEGDGASGEIEEAEPSPGASDPDRLDLTSYVLTLSDRGEQLELDLQEGEAPPAVTWTSSDPSVAAVSDDGYVMPVGEGTAVITAALQSDPSIQVSCAVFVQTTQENDWQFLPDVV